MTGLKTISSTVQAVRARRQFWVDERDRARAAKNDQTAGSAQRLIDEYDAFIQILERTSEEQPLMGYRQARR